VSRSSSFGESGGGHGADLPALIILAWVAMLASVHGQVTSVHFGYLG